MKASAVWNSETGEEELMLFILKQRTVAASGTDESLGSPCPSRGALNVPYYWL